LQGRDFALFDDGIQVHIESADVANVPLNHESCGVLPVQVGRSDSIEEFVAQATISVEKHSDKVHTGLTLRFFGVGVVAGCLSALADGVGVMDQ